MEKKNKTLAFVCLLLGLIVVLAGLSCWRAYRRGHAAVAETLAAGAKLNSIGLSRQFGGEIGQPAWLPHWQFVFAGSANNVETAHVALVSGACVVPKKEKTASKQAPHLQTPGRKLLPNIDKSLSKPGNVRRMEE